MEKNYSQNYKTLVNPEKALGDRFQAAMSVLSGIDKSKETAAMAANDLEGYINLLKDGKEGQLSLAVFDVLSKLSTMKDQRENFSKAGFPEFCADLWKDEKFRLRSSFMVMSLLQESGMVKEMVDIGMVDLLIRYSDWVDRQLAVQKPSIILRTRRFIFESLKVISQHKSHIPLLVEKNVIHKIKRNCFGLTFANDLSNHHLGSDSINAVKRDEILLQSIGLEVLFNICQRFENYGRLRRVIRKEEVKYIYDYESETGEDIIDNPNETQPNVATQSNSAHPVSLPVASPQLENIKVTSEVLPKKPSEKTIPVAKAGNSIPKLVMQQLVATKIMDDVMGATFQQSLEMALSGLRIIYRLCSVLHLFVKYDERLKIINQILDVASKLSGQRRHNCFSCLIVLSRHPENCEAFVATPVFGNLFFLGMEESGEVLNQLVKVLRNLSLHNSTALEQALFSDIPKLLTKILHQDFKDDISSPPPTEADSKEGNMERTPAVAMLTVYALALKFGEARNAMIRAGIVPVLIKLLNEHPEDILGMHVLMTLSCLASVDESWAHLIPSVHKPLVLMILDALHCSMNEQPYQGFFYSPLEITKCLMAMSSDKKNSRILATGLPLYLKILHVFVEEYGIKNLEERISTRTVGNVATLLQNICRVKTIMARVVELGPQVYDLLDDAQAMTSEAEQDTEFNIDNESSITLQYLHLAVQDELGLTKAREEVGDRIRFSSRIDLGKALKEKANFKKFMEKKRLSEFV